MRNKALEDARTQITQYSIVDEDELHRQPMVEAEETRLKNLREMEERMRVFGES